MDTAKELRSSIVSGVVTALIVSIPQIIWVGIGGALVSAVMGSVVSSAAGVATSRITQKAQEALRAQTQITGVLDSSQLGVDERAIEKKLPFKGRGKVVTIAVSLVTSLVTGMIVAAVTSGTGINFYLGGMPTVTQSTSASNNTSADTESQNQQDWQPEVTITHYDTDAEATSETSLPSLPTQDDATDQGSSTSTDGNNQPESETSSGTDSAPTEQTTPSGSTIENDTQQAQP